VSVPVLMYHHVLPERGFIASSIKQFESQMRFLAEDGWKTLSSEEFLSFKKGKYSPPKKSVLITFDDGWRDNYEVAYPILKKYGLKATLFVITEWVDKASEVTSGFFPCQHNLAKSKVCESPSSVFCSWDHLELMRDVFDYQSHTHTHRDCYFSEICWEDEFSLSKQLLKERLGVEANQICWPRGEFNAELVEMLPNYGFDLHHTTMRGANKFSDFEIAVKRIAVKNDEKWLKKTLSIFSNDLLAMTYGLIKSR